MGSQDRTTCECKGMGISTCTDTNEDGRDNPAQELLWLLAWSATFYSTSDITIVEKGYGYDIHVGL